MTDTLSYLFDVVFTIALLVLSLDVGFKIVHMYFDEGAVFRDLQRILRKAVAARAGHGQATQARPLNDIAISVTYLKRVKYRHSQLGMILLITAAAFYALVYMFDLGVIRNLVIAPLVLYILLLLKGAVLQFRITHGLFGTNAHEARTMINFLLENAAEIDFTDGSGKPKRALLPERVSDQTPGGIPAQGVKV